MKTSLQFIYSEKSLNVTVGKTSYQLSCSVNSECQFKLNVHCLNSF